jgi:hypothetical protein
MNTRDAMLSQSDITLREVIVEQLEVGVEMEQLKKDVKKLNAQATTLKMNLHDLAEDLPIGWEQIPELAEQTYQTYKNLMAARQRLADAGG